MKERRKAPAKGKLSFNEKREFEQLPGRIEKLEREREELRARVAGPEFYKEGAAVIRDTLARVEAAGAELDAAYRRWDELDSRA